MDKAKSYFWVLLDLLIVGIIVNLVFFVMPAIKRYVDSPNGFRTLTVSGEGKTFVSPDVAYTSFAVVSRGKNPEELADNNNQKVAAAIAFVKGEGIEAKDIQTTGYNLSPDYKYDPQTERNFITGYTLTQTVSVKIRDLAKVAKIIGGLTPLGVNQIGGVSFSIDDPEQYLAQARAEAFKRARAKAEDMARQNGVKLGKIINFGEYGGPPPIPYYRDFTASKFLGAGGEVAAPLIEPGTQEIRVTASVTYELE